MGGQCRRRTTHPLPDPPLERAGVFPSTPLPLKGKVHDDRSPVKLALMPLGEEGKGEGDFTLDEIGPNHRNRRIIQ